MNTTQSLLTVVVSFFLMTFVTGFWLRRSNRPFSGLRLNIHKLIGLAAGGLLLMTIYRVNQGWPQSPPLLSAVLLTLLLLVGTIISGGLSSLEKQLPPAVLAIHRIAPYVTALSSAGSLYLLFYL